jgi:hypothetical protein
MPALPIRIVVGVTVALAAVAIASAAASAAPRTYFAQSPDSAGGPYKVRPPTVYFGAGGGLFARGLRWRDWGDRVAVGRGVAWQRSCEPSCAQGGYRRDRAKLRLAQPARLDGRRQYRCWRFTILAGPNRGVAARGCRPA